VITFVLKMVGRALLFHCFDYVSMLGNSQVKYKHFLMCGALYGFGCSIEGIASERSIHQGCCLAPL
jgi:hypothetical protein